MTELLLWLFVINLGIALGAGLYESRIMVPQWLIPSLDNGYHWNGAGARNAGVGLRFWVYVTTVPLTLLTLASLVATWSAPDAVHHWWIVAVIVAMSERVMTFSYFIPEMIRLTRGDFLEHSRNAVRALRWVRLGYIRHATTLVAWLAALKALSLVGKNGV